MTMTMTAESIRAALTLRDLTDPGQGPHAMQLLLDEIERTLASRWRIPVRREPAHPIVSVRDNYDRLLISPDAVARDARCTRYLNEGAILRTHTSAIIPPALDRLQADLPPEVLLSCPDVCYRRDSIDRHHTGEPHQLDLWRIRCLEPALTRQDLLEMIVGTRDGPGPRPHPHDAERDRRHPAPAHDRPARHRPDAGSGAVPTGLVDAADPSGPVHRDEVERDRGGSR